MLADEVDDAPAAIALLDVRERERRDFRGPEAATEKNGKDRAVAQPAQSRYVRCVEKRLCLASRKPVAPSDSDGFRALYPGDSRGGLGH